MSPASSYLLVRSGDRHCGLPVAQVVEILRPLPIQAIAGVCPDFVLGLARLRGEAVPVLDLRLLLGDTPTDHGSRLVSLSHAGRKVALAVDEVLGLTRVAPALRTALPPLLEAGSPAVESLASLDGALLLLLRSARLFPPEGLALS